MFSKKSYSKETFVIGGQSEADVKLLFVRENKGTTMSIEFKPRGAVSTVFDIKYLRNDLEAFLLELNSLIEEDEINLTKSTGKGEFARPGSSEE